MGLLFCLVSQLLFDVFWSGAQSEIVSVVVLCVWDHARYFVCVLNFSMTTQGPCHLSSVNEKAKVQRALLCLGFEVSSSLISVICLT